ncbi:G-type lectin S-receptor-like serine/threonine-protein kinase At4g27290 [Daucus carota subsp. sativus]|uniref:G-type lectin S-receptor-like serine/threonine-protein kinase At4g27290 n=1 Tax=Daucus carota subsp. sativus TaxID=79200 RepID=UPI0030834C47
MDSNTVSLKKKPILQYVLKLMERTSTTSASVTLIFCIFVFSLSLNSIATEDIIRPNQSVRDGNTIVSAGGQFELGFIGLGNSTNRYVGIWYKKIPLKTIVWIANRETPLNTTSGLLKLNTNGILVILDSFDNVVWSSNSSTPVNSPVAQLLDSGNLVIRDVKDSDPANYLWQSFDIPGNTFLPGCKLGWNLETGLERYLSSWKTDDDPSPGEYTNRIDPNGFPQLLTRKGSAIHSRAGPWNGVRFSAAPNFKSNPIYEFYFVSNDKELYYYYKLLDNSVSTRIVLSPSGSVQRWVWIEKSQIWRLYLSGPIDDCDRYKLCGPYGSCNINRSPKCECLDGFEPKSQKEWDVADWSSGCARKVELTCADGEGFVKQSGLILPDTQSSWFDRNMSLDECKRLCLKNCSCTAYANTDIRGSGSGCLLWLDKLIDIREQGENGQDLYIRMAASELAKKGRSKIRFMIIPILLTVTTMLGACLWVIRKKKKHPDVKIARIKRLLYLDDDGDFGNGDKDAELPLFDFSTLASATNGFSTDSKLGEGGFGAVYKTCCRRALDVVVGELFVWSLFSFFSSV